MKVVFVEALSLQETCAPLPFGILGRVVRLQWRQVNGCRRPDHHVRHVRDGRDALLVAFDVGADAVVVEILVTGA